MNDKIVQSIKDIINSRGVKYTYVSKTTGIEYQRLSRILNQNAIISGSELLCLCKHLNIDINLFMELLD